MLNAEDAELLTRVGPGTGMGRLMRAYWLPVLYSSELPSPDCAPVRVRHLGEKLIAFRDSAGRVGLLDEFCPHRRASLYFGRNEDGGLRCVYHGWKFTADGHCVDLPSEPPDSPFKSRIRTKHYPVAEAGGVIWAYLGPDPAPAPPAYEWMTVPPENTYRSKRVLECNWAQALEGDIDSSHASILHSRLNPADYAHLAGVKALTYFDRDRYPRYEVLETDYGLILTARRNAEEDTYYWRATQYLMPVMVMISPFDDELLQVNMWVPMDDVTTMVWTLHWHPSRPIDAEERAKRDSNLWFHCTRFEPANAEAGGAWRPTHNQRNNYLADRRVQETTLFSHVEPYWAQDKAVQESMGPIADRFNEHLAPSDLAISRWRRSILAAARAMDQGVEPAGRHPRMHRVRPVSVVLPRGADWKADVQAAMRVGD